MVRAASIYSSLENGAFQSTSRTRYFNTPTLSKKESTPEEVREAKTCKEHKTQKKDNEGEVLG